MPVMSRSNSRGARCRQAAVAAAAAPDRIVLDGLWVRYAARCHLLARLLGRTLLLGHQARSVAKNVRQSADV